MAPPSSNYTLIALLVAFAVVTPSLLHQSTAVRDGGAAKAAAAPAASANGEVVLQPTATYQIPDLPLPRILPCPPNFPKIPFIPCYNETAPPPTPPPPPQRPEECRPSLEMLMPLCAGFLTNSSKAPKDPSDNPSDKCCDGVSGFMNGDRSIYYRLCLCHIENGDVNQLLTAPVDHERALSLVQTCLGITPDAYIGFCNDDNLKKLTPPMELPKPPTSAPGNKA